MNSLKLNDGNGKTDTQLAKEKALEQFVRRKRYAFQIEKIDNSGLHAGSPMYFYCKHCGIPTEVLPEDYLFPPLRECSQCQGLQKEGWLNEAIRIAQEEEV
jgi:endogenous inhibitor of DNA gyrase (YacG/DUF329 family)